MMDFFAIISAVLPVLYYLYKIDSRCDKLEQNYLSLRREIVDRLIDWEKR